MAEKELGKTNKSKVTKVAKAGVSKVGKKKFVTVDTPIQDVLDSVEKGDDIRFDDRQDSFLELPSDVYKVLPLEVKERYMLAKELYMHGFNSVVKTVEDGLRGWKRDYSITPGSPSDKLKVMNKDDKYDYKWSNPAKLGKRGSEDWEIDRDPNIRTYDQVESEIGQAVPKAVGGRDNPELLLIRRRKEAGKKFRADKAAKYDAYTTRAKDNFIENVGKAGAKAVVDK